MPDTEWKESARYVIEALRTLDESIGKLRDETSRFTLSAAEKFVRLDQQDREIQRLTRELDRMRDERAEYREQTAVRLSQIEQAIKNRDSEANRSAALVSAMVGGGVSIITAIIAATWAKS